MISSDLLRIWAGRLRCSRDGYAMSVAMDMDAEADRIDACKPEAKPEPRYTAMTFYANSPACVACPHATATKPEHIVLNAASVTVNCKPVDCQTCASLQNITRLGSEIRRKDWARRLRSCAAFDGPTPCISACIQFIADEMEGKDHGA